MALQCQVQVNVSTYSAGQTPVPLVTLVVYNPNAAAVVVTGVNMRYRALDDTSVVNRTAASPAVPPIGFGQTTSVPATSILTIGPFGLAVGSAANANSYQSANPAGVVTLASPQLSQKPQWVLCVGADVYGSDGSVNVAGEDWVLISYTSQPPLGLQGGSAMFNAPNNACLVAAGVA